LKEVSQQKKRTSQNLVLLKMIKRYYQSKKDDLQNL